MALRGLPRQCKADWRFQERFSGIIFRGWGGKAAVVRKGWVQKPRESRFGSIPRLPIRFFRAERQFTCAGLPSRSVTIE
jgi:hypothetical protein